MRKGKKARPRVYDDGLIPAMRDSYQSYPEVVRDDYDNMKNEKSYPEVAHTPSPPPAATPDSLAPAQQLNATSPLTTCGGGLSASGSLHAQYSHQHHHPLTGDILVPLPVLPLSRNSGVHSLQQVWSDADHDLREELPREEGTPLWKRPIVWVIAIALGIIMALAGLLGGVASGAIKTAWDSGTGTTSPPPSPSIPNPSCPSANNRNYTSTTTTITATTSTTMMKTFRIQCGADYPGGDGALGLVNTTTTGIGVGITDGTGGTTAVGSIAGCLDECARVEGCVAAVFRPGSGSVGTQCWLKQWIGVAKAGGTEGAVSGLLWQEL
ncbi:hypothetical protein VTI74DRAFT_1087 [Chaetomium olivicolor]